jgi:hypothetical protein
MRMGLPARSAYLPVIEAADKELAFERARQAVDKLISN